jgi:sucrose-6-phosphate hydrolase SacC (GH32 family)
VTNYRILLIVFLNFSACKIQAQHKSVTSASTYFNEQWRPRYHLTPIKGWVNDPTALVYVNGLYQVNKRMAVSRDLIHWKRSDRKNLYNQKDSVGEMSGSAVLDVNNTSGFGKNGKPPLVSIYSGLRFRDIRQFQCISYSNDEGLTWTKYDRNPVIDIGSTEFRDPQVFWYPAENKWLMVVAWADKRKIRFYSSPNLKEWTFLSDFGPAGADNGVWECPDFFPLPVDDNKQNIKWVLETSVQPAGGQYFLGSFDGKTFVVDENFNLQTRKKSPVGTLVFDFENDLSGWKKEGDAFNGSPSAGQLPMQGAILNYEGNKLVNSFYYGDSTIGRLISPVFKITNKYINFLVGGGDDADQLSINLIVGTKKVRSATGTNTEVLSWKNWDVSEYIGKDATIEIVDSKTGGFGHILADQFILSNEPARNETPEAFWIDYGPDFYAVRSWVNGPENDDRRIWSAWMSNWLYANQVPTKTWKGIHTFPRTVRLKTFPEGVRLIQQPIAEIATLRSKYFHAVNIPINVSNTPLSFKPARNSYEMIAEIYPGKSTQVRLNFFVGRNEKTILNYDVVNQLLSIDRSNSGNVSFSKSFPGVYTAPLKLNRNGKIILHILVDQCSIEVFGNDGESTITCQVFPETKSIGIEIYSIGGNANLAKLDAWELLPFWVDKK